MHLIDTNILIYYSNGSIPDAFRSELERIFVESFRISVITQIEYLGWRGFDTETFAKAQQFISYAEILPIHPEIADQSISLRRQYSIKLADAVIAATSITYGLTLLTRNEEDFAILPDISVTNPFNF